MGKESVLQDKLKLYGFNNLTKNLSFNIYDICYARSEKDRQEYLEYIDEQYNSERLSKILYDVTEQIGAHVLNISKQDYDPQGASVNILIAEAPVPESQIDPSNNCGNYEAATMAELLKRQGGAQAQGGPQGQAGAHMQGGPRSQGPKAPQAQNELERRAGAFAERQGGVDLHAHLDKSHLTVHTFPEAHPEKAISTFRVDIDVSTCGTVSPLNSLDYLIDSFDSDIITIDYRVRGFTREKDGRKCFLDNKLSSIQEFISDETLKRYFGIDINLYQANLFHTRLMLKEIELQNYLFNLDQEELKPVERLKITEAIQEEMIDIYSGMNVYD